MTLRPLWSGVSLNSTFSMFILYLAPFSSFWFQWTRSGEMIEPTPWQRLHSWSGSELAGAATPKYWVATTRCRLSQVEPALLAWQPRQASLLVRLFQLSPCGVFGFAAVWHLLQLRRSCGKPTSAKLALVSR